MLFVSLALLTTAGLAAANRLFQPKLQPPVMKSLRSNATTSDHQKRWLGVETGSNNYDIQLWKNGEVTYHINDNPNLADKDAMKKLEKLIDTAVELWHSSGLPENFKFTKASSDMACLSDRDNCLMISLNEDAIDETTVGRPPLNIMKGIPGPIMNIDIANLANGWTPSAVVAHEIGHAWGLHHEHQNPRFWAKKYNSNEAYDGNIFGDANFACTDLPDYGKARLEALMDGGGNAALLCTSYVVAQQYQFSATNFLPLVSGYVLPDAENELDPDWRSIMMYSTYQTGLKVLSKPDGSDILPPLVPSERDVSGLVALYGGKGKKPDTNLLLSPHNPNQASFLKIACGE